MTTYKEGYNPEPGYNQVQLVYLRQVIAVLDKAKHDSNIDVEDYKRLCCNISVEAIERLRNELEG